MDSHGIILYANAASEVLLKAWEVTVGSVAPEFLVAQVTEANAAQEVRVIEVQVRERTFTVTFAPIRGLGYCNVYGMDITDRKRAETEVRQLNQDLERRAAELATANTELESFTYSVSHDLRTPLAAIGVFSQVLQDDYGSQLSEQAQHFLGMIHSNAQQMEALIQSLLNLSRLSRQAIKTQPVDMAALVEDALDTLQFKVHRPDLAIDVRPLPEAAADPCSQTGMDQSHFQCGQVHSEM